MTAHAVFDRIWKEKYMRRGEAYAWMSEEIGLGEGEAHIGRFNMEQCERLIAIVDAYFDSKPKKMKGSPYKGAPLRKIVDVRLGDDYPRTGWYVAILECGHEVPRFGYCRKGVKGPRGVKTKRCYCIQCREPLV